MTLHSKFATAVASTALILGATVAGLAQRNTPADIAAKFTGAWKINFDLSPQFAPRAGGAGGRRGGTPSAPSFAIGSVGMRQTPAAFQRGGPQGGGQMSEADRAGQAAIRGLQQVADAVTITATVDSVTFKDARGERTYAVDNKSVKLDIGGAQISAKSRWDRNTLKQEFVFGETKVAHDWELNNEGTRINFKMQITNMANTGMGATTEAKAVYDKQP